MLRPMQMPVGSGDVHPRSGPPRDTAGVRRVVHRHHALVRVTHWLNVPLLLGLIMSGLSIYWASPVFRHTPDPVTGTREYLQDIGRVMHGLTGGAGAPRDWVYETFGLGPRQLALALRLHWALAYLFMLNGLLYAIGLVAGGGWRALLPRRSDPGEALAMIRYYLGVVPAFVRRRPWPHPAVPFRYNALQRAAYAGIAVAGGLAVLSGWAMHQPVQLGWLERAFGSYDIARVVHFACMVMLGAFVVPHVALVIADGWDTFRSMVTGWSTRVKDPHERA
jgi:thiosulfate reductase cytochrome b subunit